MPGDAGDGAPVACGASPGVAVSGTAPALDDTGRTFLVLAYGPAGAGSDLERACREWADQAERLGKDVELHVHDRSDGPALAHVDALLAAATVGVRLVVAGTAQDVRRTVARARRAGVLPSELTEHVLADGPLDVFCPHCAATTETSARPGDTVTCGGCSRTLDIRAHVASWTGTFLGSGTDSEPRPGAHTLPVPAEEAHP